MRHAAFSVLLALAACGRATPLPPVAPTPAVTAAPVADIVVPAAEPTAASAAPVGSAAPIAPSDYKSSTIAGVLNGSSDPPVDLSEAAMSGKGVDSGGLHLGGGGGGAIVAGRSGGLAGIGGGAGAPAQARVTGPVGSVHIGSVKITGNMADASAVIAGLAAGFRGCYGKGLGDDPSMRGSVVITGTIGPSGEVQNATVSAAKGLSQAVIGCVRARLALAQFAPSSDGSGTVVIPLAFDSKDPSAQP